MSSITDVIVVLGNCFEGDGEIVAAEITKYIISEGHLPFALSDSIGGGEKVMTTSMLIGAFNCFDAARFKGHLLGMDWKAIGHCGSVMLAYKHEDDVWWTAENVYSVES